MNHIDNLSFVQLNIKIYTWPCPLAMLYSISNKGMYESTKRTPQKLFNKEHIIM
jgi:hypothetical protein